MKNTTKVNIVAVATAVAGIVAFAIGVRNVRW